MREAFTHYTDQNLTIIGLTIFGVFFLSVLFLVTRKAMQSHYKYMSELPLNENKGDR